MTRGHGGRRRTAAVMGLAALCLLLAVGAAAGAPRKSDPPMTGAPWPAKRTIGVYDATPKIWRRSIEAAIADWNSSGLKVRFALVKTRSKAQVVMTSKKLKNMGGWATIGRSFGQGQVVLDAGHPPTVERPLDGQFIVTHELGHILGLDHARRACSVMNYAYLTVCPKPQLGFRVCGHVRSADVKALAPAYGGVTKKLSSRFCPSPHDTHLDVFFFPGDDPNVFALVQINPAVPAGTELVVERRSGSCSSSRTAAAVTERFAAGSITGTDGVTVDPATGARYAAGAYCYRYWVLDTKTKLTGTRFEHPFAFAG